MRDGEMHFKTTCSSYSRTRVDKIKLVDTLDQKYFGGEPAFKDPVPVSELSDRVQHRRLKLEEEPGTRSFADAVEAKAANPVAAKKGWVGVAKGHHRLRRCA